MEEFTIRFKDGHEDTRILEDWLICMQHDYSLAKGFGKKGHEEFYNDLMGHIREITLGLLEQDAFGMHGCEITEIK